MSNLLCPLLLRKSPRCDKNSTVLSQISSTCSKRLKKTIDELTASRSIAQIEPKAASSIAQGTRTRDLEDPLTERYQHIQGQLRSARDKIGDLESYVGELEEKFEKSLETIEAYHSENRSLELELNTLHEQNEEVVKTHNKLVDDEVGCGRDVREAYLSWAARQDQRGL